MSSWTYDHPRLGHQITISPGSDGEVSIEVVDDPDARIVWPTRIKVPAADIPDLIAALQNAADPTP